MQDAGAGDGAQRLTPSRESLLTVGVDVATSPGSVVCENDLAQLLQYFPATSQVHETPIPIVPPCILPFTIAQKKGDPIIFDKDEFLNRKTTAEGLAGLRPAFDKAGTVTAGNASGINDGAAAVMVMSAKKAAALGLTPLASIRAFATSGLDPATMGMGPVPATQKALARAGWKASDVDLYELNEAFAAQACAVNRALDIDPARVNVNGGAIAIGHPIGASGCRVLVTLLHELKRRSARRGLAALCIGGGMGVALAVERA